MADDGSILGKLQAIEAVSKLAQREPSLSAQSIVEYNLVVIEQRIAEIRTIMHEGVK